MNDSYNWYQELVKPIWAPPAWLFGPVWTILYGIIAISFGMVFFRVAKGQIPYVVVIPFILNLVTNLAFSPIQFGLRNNTLALVDIVLVLGTLIWALVAIYPHMKWVTLVNIPYLVWVSFATILQITITILNWK